MPSDMAGRKVFKVFNQEFVVDERYNVTKELGQGAYGIVWLAFPFASSPYLRPRRMGILAFPTNSRQ
jgi:hypothetical protein